MNAADFLSRFDATAAPHDAARTAADAFRATGLPTMRDEAWRFTNLRPLAERDFTPAQPGADVPADLLARLPALDAPRAVFVDGFFRTDLSTAANTGAPAVAARTREPLAALNTMFAQPGLALDVPANTDAGTLVLASIATGNGTDFHPRHRIRLAPGARLTVLDVSIGDGAYLHNAVLEIDVAADAHLTHVRLQDESDAGFHVSTIYADIAERGTYDSFGLTLGARLARAEVHARLGGAHGAVHLNAAQLLAGTQHADFTTIVSHDAPNCASRQTVKNVLTGRSRGVFQGKIEVARGAQKTDGYQMNQALLLSPDAEIDSKPQLEIYADDVKCSHGATVGELDEDQLFYLRSRGIPQPEARAILVRAFLTEALDTVANEPIRAVLEQAVAQWWQRHPA